MKRAAGSPPPFPLKWECDVCHLKGLTVQFQDDHQASACVLCERILCHACSDRHFIGGQLCWRAQGDKAF